MKVTDFLTRRPSVQFFQPPQKCHEKNYFNDKQRKTYILYCLHLSNNDLKVFIIYVHLPFANSSLVC